VEPAARLLKMKKAPSLDGIPPEVVKTAIDYQKEEMTALLNRQWQAGEFPRIWTEARLVILEKPKTAPDAPVTYRPECLLSSLGKLMEITVNQRLLKEIDKTGGLADEQHGFRRGRSMVTAMQRVVDIATYVNSGAYRRRHNCVMISLDVQNAFNAAPWEGILETARRQGIAPYVIRMLSSYLEERSLLGLLGLLAGEAVPQIAT
jgi:hypothetical protein